MKILIKTADPLSLSTDCLIVFTTEKKPAGLAKSIDQSLNGALSTHIKAGRYKGDKNQTCLLDTRGELKADNVLFVGIGASEDACLETIRQATGTALRLAEKNRFKNPVLCYPENDLGKLSGAKNPDAAAPWQAMAEAAPLALFHFDEYKSREEKPADAPPRITSITLLSPEKKRENAIRKAADTGQALASAVILTRNLQWHPGNHATPQYLVSEAKKQAKSLKFSCKALGVREMEKLGMGSLLGVGQGSDNPPSLIVMEYNGGGKKDAPVAIVGKGITFDTGGISLKPGAGMDEMKYDMSGGAVTIGTLAAAARLKLKVNLVGIVAAAENMPSGRAIRPGDILKASNGKTIEVLNTDAEGRLVLADALVYAQRYKPKAVIDLATLTGACIVALGHQAAAVVGTDQQLIDRLLSAGAACGERLWQLPLYEEFEKSLKSDVADLKNISAPGVGGGTIVGGAFLKSFVGDFPWAHLDIAGTAWSGEDKPYVPKGGSGYGVRLLIEYLQSL